MPSTRRTLNTPESDAQEFGNHVRHGGWRLALLAARNVRVASRGRPPKDAPDDGKLTASEFARLAKISRQSVDYYLRAWNSAASEGVVPPSSEVEPGSDVSLPVGDDSHDRWITYYRRARAARTPSPSGSVTPIRPGATTLPSTPMARLTGAVRALRRANDYLHEIDLSTLDAEVAASKLAAHRLAEDIQELADVIPAQFAQLTQLVAQLDPDAVSDDEDTEEPAEAM